MRNKEKMLVLIKKIGFEVQINTYSNSHKLQRKESQIFLIECWKEANLNITSHKASLS